MLTLAGTDTNNYVEMLALEMIDGCGKRYRITLMDSMGNEPRDRQVENRYSVEVCHDLPEGWQYTAVEGKAFEEYAEKVRQEAIEFECATNSVATAMQIIGAELQKRGI